MTKIPTPIADRSAWTRLVNANEKVRSLAIAVQATEDALADVGRRKEALEQRLAAEEARRPQEDHSAEESAADVLLANPSASTTSFLERFTGAKRKRDQSLAEWRAGLAPIKAAIRKAAYEIEKREREIAELKAERDKALQAFDAEAYPALLAEAERRFAALHDEVIAPLYAIEARSPVEGPKLQPNVIVSVRWRDANRAYSVRDRVIFPRMEVRKFGVDTLRTTTTSRSVPVDPAPYLEKLRAALAAERG